MMINVLAKQIMECLKSMSFYYNDYHSQYWIHIVYKVVHYKPLH